MKRLAGLEYGEIASKLAAVAAKLPGEPNAFRDALQRVSVAFAPTTRNLTEGRRELVNLLYALTSNGQVFDEPETWITCACIALFAFDQMQASGGTEGPVPGALLS